MGRETAERKNEKKNIIPDIYLLPEGEPQPFVYTRVLCSLRFFLSFPSVCEKLSLNIQFDFKVDFERKQAQNMSVFYHMIWKKH